MGATAHREITYTGKSQREHVRGDANMDRGGDSGHGQERALEGGSAREFRGQVTVAER